MSDKSPSENLRFFALPDYRVISLIGRDAVKFTQAQVMSDLATLEPGHWQWSGWLTPKGRLVALFALLRVDAESIWLLVPDADAEALVAALGRFVFRSKLALAATDLHVAGAFAGPEMATGNRLSGEPGGEVQLDLSAAGGARSLRISEMECATEPAAHERWRAHDLAHGLPRLDREQFGQWTPQQLSLERLRAYSVKKGCYPGQEIVARTHFLGQAKRGLVLLHTQGPATPGASVVADGRDIGKVVSSAGNSALAVLPLERPDGALEVDGATCQVRPLLDGLAR